MIFYEAKLKIFFYFFIHILNNLLLSRIIYVKMNIGDNIKKIRELKNYSQEYLAQELGISQPAYARIESGTSIPKIDRLQHIAEILEVDISTLLNTSVFHFIFNAAAHQSGYIQNQTNNSIDIEIIRKIIQEEIKKIID